MDFLFITDDKKVVLSTDMSDEQMDQIITEHESNYNEELPFWVNDLY